MKALFLSLISLALINNISLAQSLVSKVPAEASFVVKYSGASLLQKLPANKFDSYKYIKKSLYKELQLDKKTSIANIGIDLQKDAYQYSIINDTADFFVTLFNINDEVKFNSFIKKSYKPTVAFASMKGYKFYAVTKNTFVGWDSKMAVLISSNYNSYKWYQSSYEAPAIDSTKMYEGVGNIQPYADSTVSLEEVPNAKYNDSLALIMAADSLAAAAAAAADEVKKMEVQVDTAVAYSDVAVDTVQAPVEYQETEYQKKERLAREKFEKDLEIYNDSVRQSLTQDIMYTTFNSTVPSITKSESFNKLLDNTADINIWIDSTGFLNRVWREMFHPSYLPRYYSYRNDDVNTWPGGISGINIYFEKDKVRMTQTLFSENKRKNTLLRESFNSKQSAALANYVHPSDLGYFSSSMNTEALVHYYYTVLKSVYSNMTYTRKYAPAVDAYVDLLEAMIDEKGIADMVTGNVMFILHKVKPKTVKYIDYQYDKEFGSKEVEKTKIETSPDFSVVFETRNENIFNKFADLPIKLKQNDSSMDYDYVRTGDYYVLTLGEKNMLDKLYFKVKDGQCIITTLLDNVANAAYNRTATMDAATIASIANNNYSAKFNIKDILKGAAINVSDKKNKKILDYLQQNAGTLLIESSIKDDTIQSNTTLSIVGNHKNSLEYFFNLMETILQMDEPAK